MAIELRAICPSCAWAVSLDPGTPTEQLRILSSGHERVCPGLPHREVLEFYAAPETYRFNPSLFGAAPIELDKGARARAALEPRPGDTEGSHVKALAAACLEAAQALRRARGHEVQGGGGIESP